jgi:molecular chaperone GrpE
MSDKPTNGADGEDEDEIPVEVDGDAITRPVNIPDLGASLYQGAADDGEVEEDTDAETPTPPDAAGLDRDDLLELLGQAETEKVALAARVEQLEQQLAASQAETKDHYERLLRAHADMENLRRRTRKDIDDGRIDARGRVVKEVLPVIDNLDRAAQHAEQANDPGSIAEGVKLVLRQFAQSLERVEVTPIDAQGQPFDPNLHEAVSQAETDEVPPGSVYQVLQRGYKIGDRLLRPALVVVAQAAAGAKPAAAPAVDHALSEATPMPPADSEGDGDGGDPSGANGADPDAKGEPEQEA